MCAEAKAFAEFLLPACGHVNYCKPCYLQWLQENPSGGCPQGCPVPLKEHYTPFIFPGEWKLNYTVAGDVGEGGSDGEAAGGGDSEAPAQDLARDQGSAPAQDSARDQDSAPAQDLASARFPATGTQDAFTWLQGCGMSV